MTTICAIVNGNGEIRMAADIRITDPESGRYWDSTFTPKIACKNNLLYGVAGDQPLVQHLIYEWEPPEELLWDPVLAMQTQIMPSLKEHIGDMDGEWEMLIGFDKMLFIVDKTGFTHDTRHNSAAIGSGAQYALGYLFISSGDVSQAVRTAAFYNLATSTECIELRLPNAPKSKLVK